MKNVYDGRDDSDADEHYEQTRDASLLLQLVWVTKVMDQLAAAGVFVYASGANARVESARAILLANAPGALS